MEVDVGSAGTLVISHGHFDHTGGLPDLMRVARKGMRLVAHPGAFERKIDEEGKDVGSPVGVDELGSFFDLHLFTESHRIERDVYLLTGIERKYEDPGTVVFHFVDGIRQPDPVMDDSSLALKTDRGIFIITGCGHAGVMNIVNEAREQLGDDVYGLAGGLHLLEASEGRIFSVIASLRKLGLKKVYPCHCTGQLASFLLTRHFAGRKIYCGDSLDL